MAQPVLNHTRSNSLYEKTIQALRSYPYSYICTCKNNCKQAEYHKPMNLQPNRSRSTLFCAVVGPTASGKSSLSMQLAEQMNCPIVSVDSMQVYRGLNVGTSKPSIHDQEKVKHYGLDLAEPTEWFSADRYRSGIEPVLENALSENQPLIFCGGTGLYFRALLEGFIPMPDPDRALRDRLLQQVEEQGGGKLYDELKKHDPATAATIHPHDVKRVIRALEIFYQTGIPFSELKQAHPKKKWHQHTTFIGLRWDRERLRERIKQRTEWMFANGLVDETQWMLKLGCKPNDTAMQALGYKECAQYLLGKITLEEAEAETIQNTIHYAKRQMTWFRLQFPVHWVDCSEKRNEKDLQEECLQIW